MKTFLGIDVGGSSIKYGLVDENGNLDNSMDKDFESMESLMNS